jgi:hypothetical protein
MTSVIFADFLVIRYITYILIGHAASALRQSPGSLYFSPFFGTDVDFPLLY